ncbi:MAG: ATPase [Planctomycetes bacterium]|nr:ATPase [Planctomycetota bacterium]
MDDARVIGVDGGGTRTRVVVVSAERGVLGSGEAGSGNARDIGIEAVARHVAAARDAAYAAAGLSRGVANAAFCGMAGAGADEIRGPLTRALSAGGIASVLEVGTDLDAALAGCLCGRPGIVLIAGTGSSCLGRDATGRTARAGGLGSYLDDGGGATDLGRGALIACVRAHDGRGPETLLTPTVHAHLNTTSPDELARRIGDTLPRAEVAALAPLVTAAAGQGDEVAQCILADGANELAACVAAVANRLGLTEPEVALTGGLGNAPEYRPVIVDAIGRRLPHATTRMPELPAVLGSALRAFALLGIEPPARERLVGLGS